MEQKQTKGSKVIQFPPPRKSLEQALREGRAEMDGIAASNMRLYIDIRIAQLADLIDREISSQLDLEPRSDRALKTMKDLLGYWSTAEKAKGKR